MNKKSLMPALVAFVGIGFSVYADAAELSCSDITFTADAFATYEFVDNACLEIVKRDGKHYARLSASVVAQTRTSTHVRFLNQDGSRGPIHKAELPLGFETILGGKAVNLKDLAVRQEINIYISDRYWSGPDEKTEMVAAMVLSSFYLSNT